MGASIKNRRATKNEAMDISNAPNKSPPIIGFN